MPTWGRGGAGNIVNEEQIREQNARLAEDVEANHLPSANNATTATSTPTQAPDYSHMGRGGAGNWYQPSELSKEGSFTASTDSTTAPSSASKPQISTPWHPKNQEMPVARAGRGGAGNFVWKDEEAERAKEEERKKREGEVREVVEKDVEMGLQKPGQAVLGGVKAGRGW